jgi:hypothetical protein
MAKRTDSNQKEIVSTLRKCCADVLVLSDVGKGCPDLLMGYRGKNILIEVKDGKKPPSKRVLTPDEQKFHDVWRGQVCIVKSVDEALELLSDLTIRG